MKFAVSTYCDSVLETEPVLSIYSFQAGVLSSQTFLNGLAHLTSSSAVFFAQLTSCSARHLSNLATCHRVIARITRISRLVSEWADGKRTSRKEISGRHLSRAAMTAVLTACCDRSASGDRSDGAATRFFRRCSGSDNSFYRPLSPVRYLQLWQIVSLRCYRPS